MPRVPHRGLGLTDRPRIDQRESLYSLNAITVVQSRTPPDRRGPPPARPPPRGELPVVNRLPVPGPAAPPPPPRSSSPPVPPQTHSAHLPMTYFEYSKIHQCLLPWKLYQRQGKKRESRCPPRLLISSFPVASARVPPRCPLPWVMSLVSSPSPRPLSPYRSRFGVPPMVDPLLLFSRFLAFARGALALADGPASLGSVMCPVFISPLRRLDCPRSSSPWRGVLSAAGWADHPIIHWRCA